MFTRRALIAGAAAFAATRAHGAIPNLPSWLPVPTISGAGLGKVSINIPDRFALPTGDEIWIGPNGHDDSLGLRDYPFATLQRAFNCPEPVVCCLPGRYAPAELYGSTKAITAPYGGVIITASYPDTAILSLSQIVVNEGGTLAIGPGVTLEGVGVVARPWQGHQPTTILQGCSILRAYGAGLTATGGVSFASNVRVHASQYDCFNYGHDDDGNPNFAIEYNCHASDAGDVLTFGRNNPDGSIRDNRNGSSSHSSLIARYGGLYEGSLGADIADTWDASNPDQISINYGVLTRASKIGVGYLFAGGNGNPTAYLDQCASQDQTLDIIAAQSANIMLLDTDFRTKKEVFGGEVHDARNAP